MVLKADINSCEIIDWQTNTGEYNARTLQVEMCEEMRGCAMAFVTFELANGTTYESLIKDGKAEIPLFEIPQFVKIGAYSADIEGGKLTKRYSPVPCYDYVNPGSYSGNSEESPVPTPRDYANLLEQIAGIEKGTIKEVDEVDLSTCESGVYFTDEIIYKGLIPQPMTEMMPGKALLTVEKTQFGIHFFWISSAYLIAGESNEKGRFESDFTRYSLANIDNAVTKNDIITDGVIIDKTYSDEQVYNANSINTAFEEIVNILEDLDDRISTQDDSNYTLPIGGDELGGVKNGGNVVINEDGTMTAPVSGSGGMSTTAINLLIDILKVGMFTTNVSGKIESLKEALLAGGGDEPDEPTTTDDIAVTDGIMTIISVGSDISVTDGIMTIL